jgi:hypothetical protein
MVTLTTKDQLRELRSINNHFCLTVYAPLIDPNGATNPNRIVIKNLLKKAEQALLDSGASAKEVRKLLRPGFSLLNSYQFWPLRGGSIAMFMATDLFRIYHVPDIQLAAKISTGQNFNFQPIDRVLDNNRSFFVLALSHNNVRLYAGNRFKLQLLPLKGLPTNLKQALRIDEYPKSRQPHRVASAMMGKGSQTFHGQYNVNQVDKTMLQEFFRQIDKYIRLHLAKDKYPLVLVGAGYLLPIYRRVNTYHYLLDKGIEGDVKKTDLNQLREKAWSLLSNSK